MVLISQFDLFSITPACHTRENAEQLKSISAFEAHWGLGGVSLQQLHQRTQITGEHCVHCACK